MLGIPPLYCAVALPVPPAQLGLVTTILAVVGGGLVKATVAVELHVPLVTVTV